MMAHSRLVGKLCRWPAAFNNIAPPPLLPYLCVYQLAVTGAANGQQELSKSSAQQGLAVAELTGDVGALLQLWLLLTAVEGQNCAMT